MKRRRCNISAACHGSKAVYAVTERPWQFTLLMDDARLVCCEACKTEIEKRANDLVDDWCRRCGSHLLVKPEQFKRPGLWNTCRVCED